MDIHFIRENPQKVRDNQKDRFLDQTSVDEILAIDKDCRQLIFVTNKLRALKNKLSKCFQTAPTVSTVNLEDKNMKTLIDDIINEQEDEKLLTKGQLKIVSRATTDLINIAEEEQNKLLKRMDDLISRLGNILHKDVVIDNDERNNLVLESYPPMTRNKIGNPLDHIELLDKLGFVDIDSGIKIAGNRGYMFTGFGVYLNRALINYGIDFLAKQGHILVETPHFMKSDVMSQVTQLNDYQETLYKIEDYDKYLIATSEQPLTASFSNIRVENKDLPIKICGLSHCYRKEVGAHTRYTRGIYRVHQFEKLEQFRVTTPDKSWDHFDETMDICIDFYKSLCIEFRRVNIVSGALNKSASMKQDLEAYYPGSKAWGEIVSCTNVLDYFSKRIKTKDSSDHYVYMLYCTLCANTRTICALVETYQTDEGFIVPKVLQRYMNDVEFIPFKD